MVVKTDFLGYVVSDNETAYPDGDVHTDGYYYERVAELNPQMFGMTKCEIGTYTPTSDVKDVGTIYHGLGELPKLIVVTATDVTDWDSCYTRTFVSLVGTSKDVYAVVTAGIKDGSVPYAMEKSNSVYKHSDKYFRILPYSTSYYIPSGKTYFYMVMA